MEWFGDVVVGAEIEAGNAVFERVAHRMTNTGTVDRRARRRFSTSRP